MEHENLQASWCRSQRIDVTNVVMSGNTHSGLELKMAEVEPIGHVTLADITRAIILMFYRYISIKSLQVRFHLRVLDLQMSCSDLVKLSMIDMHWHGETDTFLQLTVSLNDGGFESRLTFLSTIRSRLAHWLLYALGCDECYIPTPTTGAHIVLQLTNNLLDRWRVRTQADTLKYQSSAAHWCSLPLFTLSAVRDATKMAAGRQFPLKSIHMPAWIHFCTGMRQPPPPPPPPTPTPTPTPTPLPPPTTTPFTGHRSTLYPLFTNSQL